MSLYEKVVDSVLKDERVTKAKASSNGLIFLGMGILMLSATTKNMWSWTIMNVAGSMFSLGGLFCLFCFFILIKHGKKLPEE